MQTQKSSNQKCKITIKGKEITTYIMETRGNKVKVMLPQGYGNWFENSDIKRIWQ